MKTTRQHPAQIYILDEIETRGQITVEVWKAGNVEGKVFPAYHARTIENWLMELQRDRFITQSDRLAKTAEIDQLIAKSDEWIERMYVISEYCERGNGMEVVAWAAIAITTAFVAAVAWIIFGK